MAKSEASAVTRGREDGVVEPREGT